MVIVIPPEPELQVIEAMIDFDPDTLDLGSNGRWVTCYIKLPGYDVAQIDVGSVLLNYTVSVATRGKGFHAHLHGDELVVKFERSEV